MRVICVTGMHRSGTSLLMRVLNLLGVAIGPAKQLLPPTPDNPKGYWENRSITGLNDDILRHFGGSWDEPPMLPAGWEQTQGLEALRQRAASLLDKLFEKEETYGWKDPRNSLTLPFWRTVTGVDATVLVVRRPSEVAASLKRRNGIDPERAADLWVRYVVSAFLADPNRLILDLDSLLSRRPATIQRLLAFLDLPEPDDATTELIEGFVDRSLVHADGIDLGGPRGNVANAIYQLVLEHPGGLEPALQEIANQWTGTDHAWLAHGIEPLLEEILTLSSGVDTGRLPELTASLLAAHREAADAVQRERLLNERELTERGAEAERLREELAQWVAEVERLRGEVGSREIDLARLRTEVLERRAEGERLRGELAEAERLRAELGERTAEAERLRAELGERTAEADRLLGELGARAAHVDRLHTELDALLSSTSWRLTAPIRAFGRRFPRMARAGRRFLRLAWWTVTLRIHRRLPEYVRWRRAARVSDGAMAATGHKKAAGPTPMAAGAGGRVVPGAPSMASELRRFTQPGPLYEDFDPAIAASGGVRARLLAFFLPQFHAIPENDEWWGSGFTDWRNLPRGTPRFVGHYQPRIPRDLGFYDLVDVEIMRQQIDLAKAAGIGGFCFYYYMFDEGRLLEKPLEAFLADRSLQMPFCILWANENWTRTWDGLEEDVLIRQTYRIDLEDRLLADVARHFADERYIRVAGRPLFFIYRPGLIPDTPETIARWRKRLLADFDEEPWIIMAQSFGDEDPRPFGLDGALEFPPHKVSPRTPDIRGSLEILDPEFAGEVHSYEDVASEAVAEDAPDYPLIRTVVPSWDNDARRPGRGLTLTGSSPELYEDWLRKSIHYARSNPFQGEPLVCVNAWNEWAEAAYLEPDVHFGFAYLNATARALVGRSAKPPKLRVVLVGHDAGRFGAQLLLLNIGRCLAHQFGVEVSYLLFQGGELVEQYGEVGDVVVAGPHTPEFRRAVERWHEEGVDTVLTNTTAAGAAVPKLRSCGFRVVSLVHELPQLIRERDLQASATAIASDANAVVFASSFVGSRFRAITGLSADKVVILPQGLYQPHSASTEDRDAIRRELGIPEDGQVVLGVGYADLRKGFDLFVSAARIAAAVDPTLYFVWVGNVEAQTGHWLLGAEPDDSADTNLRVVEFTDEVSKYYAAGDMLFLSSREDPYPSTVLEAMAAGLPVVAFEGSTGAEDLIRQFGELVPGQDPAAAVARFRELAALDAPTAHSAAQARREAIAADFGFDDYVFTLLQHLDPGLRKVSVVVPSYNYARHLELRLASIFEQTYPVFEVTVLDDASTDDSLEVLERIRRRTSREFCVVVNDRNTGSIMRQWRAGAGRSRGEYLWIAEADDLADPEFLEHAVAAMEDETVNFVFTDSVQINADSTVLGDSYLPYFSTVDSQRFLNSFRMSGIEFLREYLCVKNLVLNASGVLFRRESLLAVVESDLEELETFTFAGDWRTYAQLCLRGDVGFVANGLNIHRRHDDSATHRAAGPLHVGEIARVQEFIAETIGLGPEERQKQREYLREVADQLGVESIPAQTT